jgi:radical SAM protein with 4Fe4S-binding SPASM domain
LNSIFLRPLSPYGFAIKKKGYAKYDVTDWVDFYKRGLDYILELNRRGVKIQEMFATIVMRKMLTNEDPGYVDLMAPAGIGIAAVVYNYNGDVYASDESRMLAEMGDETFRIGNLLEDTYEEIFLNEKLLAPLEESMPISAPMCSECAFMRLCGADPVGSHTLFGDPVGKKPLSPFCQRNKSVFSLLIDKYENDPSARKILLDWIAVR